MIILQPGTTYAINFTTPFAALNGVFTVSVATTFDDTIASGVDFVKTLYTPLGLTNVDYNKDYPSYVGTRVYVCQNVADVNAVYYIPEGIISGTPDPTIKAYSRLVMVIDLGLQANPNVVVPLKGQFQDMVTAYLGMTDCIRYMANTSAKTYLTDTQYAALDAQRKAAMGTVTPLSQQIKQLTDENTVLRSTLAALQADIIAAQPTPAAPTTSASTGTSASSTTSEGTT